MKIYNILYKDIDKVLNNGNLLLFHGDGIISDTVEEVEYVFKNNSDISHVGIYTQYKYYPSFVNLLKYNNNLILESTGQLNILNDGIVDLLTGQFKFGVQMRNFNKVYEAYKNNNDSNIHISIGKLKNTTKILPENDILLHNLFLQKYANIGYDYSLIDLGAAVTPILRPVRNLLNSIWYGEISTEMPKMPYYDLTKPIHYELAVEIVKSLGVPANNNKVFCSELTTLYYKLFKILPNNLIAANISPVDYILNNYLDELIHII